MVRAALKEGPKAKAATREGAYFKYTPWADGVAGTPVIVDTKAALK